MNLIQPVPTLPSPPDPAPGLLPVLLHEGLRSHALELQHIQRAVVRVPLNDGVWLEARVSRVRHEGGSFPGHPVLLVAELVDVDQLLGGWTELRCEWPVECGAGHIGLLDVDQLLMGSTEGERGRHGSIVRHPNGTQALGKDDLASILPLFPVSSPVRPPQAPCLLVGHPDGGQVLRDGDLADMHGAPLVALEAAHGRVAASPPVIQQPGPEQRWFRQAEGAGAGSHWMARQQ